jgi:hypothetical protein
VIKHVNTLCAGVREDAELLIDAFAIPALALGDAARVAGDPERAPARAAA